jgi:hypothetical protein
MEQKCEFESEIISPVWTPNSAVAILKKCDRSILTSLGIILVETGVRKLDKLPRNLVPEITFQWSLFISSGCSGCMFGWHSTWDLHHLTYRVYYSQQAMLGVHIFFQWWFFFFKRKVSPCVYPCLLRPYVLNPLTYFDETWSVHLATRNNPILHLLTCYCV